MGQFQIGEGGDFFREGLEQAAHLGAVGRRPNALGSDDNGVEAAEL
jgi:hypothetical protein